MADEIQNHVGVILHSVSEEDLARLVSGIDRPLIIDFLRQNPKLHNRLFPGFRPHRVPWVQVPTKLAHDAHGDMNNMSHLLEMWLKTNEPLCQTVANEVSTETIEDDVAELLAGLGLEERNQLLWALLLDEREEVQAALIGGLREGLVNESSALIARVKLHWLEEAFKEAQQEIADLKAQLKKQADQSQILHHKAQRVDELQIEKQQLNNKLQQAEAEHQEITHRLDNAYQEIKLLQAELVREQDRRYELQQSVEDLKASLEVAIASQKETASETKRRLDETLATLEEERKKNARLRLEFNRLEGERNTAYSKRDEERVWSERLVAQVERLKHDKEVLIDEKREVHNQLKQAESKIQELRENLIKIEKEQKTMLALPHFDEAWSKAVVILAHYLTSALPNQKLVAQPANSHKRSDDWWTWQQMETSLVRPLLELSMPVSAEDLADVDRVQKLLALRWYLLEWLKLSILEMLRESNLITKQVESQDRNE